MIGRTLTFRRQDHIASVQTRKHYVRLLHCAATETISRNRLLAIPCSTRRLASQLLLRQCVIGIHHDWPMSIQWTMNRRQSLLQHLRELRGSDPEKLIAPWTESGWSCTNARSVRITYSIIDPHPAATPTSTPDFPTPCYWRHFRRPSFPEVGHGQNLPPYRSERFVQRSLCCCRYTRCCHPTTPISRCRSSIVPDRTRGVVPHIASVRTPGIAATQPRGQCHVAETPFADGCVGGNGSTLRRLMVGLPYLPAQLDVVSRTTRNVWWSCVSGWYRPHV